MVPNRHILQLENSPGFEDCRKGSGQHMERADHETGNLEGDTQSPVLMQLKSEISRDVQIDKVNLGSSGAAQLKMNPSGENGY